MRTASLLFLTALSCTAWLPLASPLVAHTQPKAATVPLPNQPDSFRFGVLGNSGTGEQAQYDLADQMAALRERFKYDAVILLGDNIQGNERPQDFVKKFEAPYKRLLEAGVTFHAALGNEDSPEQRYYKHFSMKGNLHYTFEPRPDVQFIVVQSALCRQGPDPVAGGDVKEFDECVEDRLPAPPALLIRPPARLALPRLRTVLEPLFLQYNVSVVFSAHDNIYERTKPQGGITYFVVGSGGKVQQGGIDRNTGLTASGLRDGSNISGGGDQRRPDELQRDLADWPDG